MWITSDLPAWPYYLSRSLRHFDIFDVFNSFNAA